MFSPGPKSGKIITATPGHSAKGMAIGDSFTVGLPSGLGGYRLPIFQANPGLCWVGSQSSYGYNEGYNGFRIDQISPLALASIAVLSPSIIVLMAGANDMALAGESPADTFTELQAFVTAIQAANVSVTHVLVGTIPEIPSFPDATTYNNLIRAWSPPAGVQVVDCSSTLVWPTDFDSGEHPSEAGYIKMGAIWSPAVSALLA